MACARAFMPLVGWRRSTLRSFLSFSAVTEQLAFWHAHLDTRRFRAAFDALMSPAMLRIVYARELFSFLPARFGEVIRKRLLRGFAREANATNPYARALLLEESSDERRLGFSNIEFVLGDAASYLESCAPGSFDAYSLSNILDGAAPSYRNRLSRAVRRTATKDVVLVLRSFGEPPPGLVTNHAERDRAMLWGVVDVRSAHLF